MGDLKPGWRRVKFGDVVRLSRDTCKVPAGEGIERYIGLEHIEPDDLRVRSWGDVTDGTTFTNRVRAGQVLFGKRRAYQRKVAVAEFDAICSGDIYVFESADPAKLVPELLPFICQTDAFFDHAVGTSAGSLSPRTNWSKLAEHEFALPPHEKQRELWAALNSYESAIQSFHDAARSAEGVFESLCAEILFPTAVRASLMGDSSKLRSGWRLAPIEELCGTSSDLALGPNGENLVKSDYEGNKEGVPVVFIRDIRPNRFIYTSNAFLSAEKSRKLSTHHALAGDLLVTKTGVPESLGVPPGLAAVVPTEFPQAVMTADVMRVRFDPTLVVPEYAAYLLNTPWGRRQTWRISPGSTTRFKMRLTDFARIRLPIPPTAEQAKVVDQLGRQMRVIDALRQRVHACRFAMRCFARQELGP